MTHHQRLALVLLGADERDPMGDETPALDQFEAIDVDPNAVSDLEFRLRVSNRLLAVERQAEQNRCALNKILLRFQLDGRPIPMEDVHAA